MRRTVAVAATVVLGVGLFAQGTAAYADERTADDLRRTFQYVFDPAGESLGFITRIEGFCRFRLRGTERLWGGVAPVFVAAAGQPHVLQPRRCRRPRRPQPATGNEGKSCQPFSQFHRFRWFQRHHCDSATSVA